jgi:probable FeS assembly SUF system protein SufT
MARDSITLLRDVEATFIPQGGVAVVPEGTWLVLQQALGGSFTLMTERGQLIRVDGQDADALGPQYVAEAAATAAARAASLTGPFDEQKVWTALKDVFDPEIPASIVELGLIYSVASEPVEGGHRVLVHMTLTAPGCGVGPVLVEDVKRKCLSVPGVRQADVELVFDPPWEPSRMSEAARLQLGML